MPHLNEHPTACDPLAMEGLSQAAQLARLSLEKHPDLNNPYAIFLGPINQQQMSTSEIEDGLRELEAVSLAANDFYGWRLAETPSS